MNYTAVDEENYMTLYKLSQDEPYKITRSGVLLSKQFELDPTLNPTTVAEFTLDPELNQ